MAPVFVSSRRIVPWTIWPGLVTLIPCAACVGNYSWILFLFIKRFFWYMVTPKQKRLTLGKIWRSVFDRYFEWLFMLFPICLNYHSLWDTGVYLDGEGDIETCPPRARRLFRRPRWAEGAVRRLRSMRAQITRLRLLRSHQGAVVNAPSTPEDVIFCS